MSKAKVLSVPPANAPNKQIRALAWQRTKACYWRLVAASILMSIPAAISLFGVLPFKGDLLKFSINRLVGLLFTPMNIGVSAYFYAVYLNGNYELGEVFCFYREKRSLITALLLGLVQAVLLSVNSMPNFMKGLLPEDNLLIGLVFGLLGFVLPLLYCYFTARLYLVNYIFARDKSKSALQNIQESLRYTRGAVRRILWFGITTMWWVILLLSAALGIGVGLIFTKNPSMTWLVYTAVLLIYIFCVPYVGTAVAGYAHKLLPSERTERKKGKRNEDISSHKP